MPLQSLADEIIRLSEQRTSTPVLVTSSYLSLRQRFLLELVGALANRTPRSLRIDWYRRIPGYFSLIGDRLALAQTARNNRALDSLMSGHEPKPVIQITASIGRPGGAGRDLVIGLCDENLELPPWTTPIRLGGTPSEFLALQSSAK